MDDAEVIERSLTGDVDAFGVLVGRYRVLAHRTAVMFGAGDEADDVVQEAFVKAYRALGRFRLEAEFRPWLLRIVVNETKNLHRSRQRRDGLALRGSDLEESFNPEDVAVSRERQGRLLARVRGLPEKDRQVVTCRYFLELTEAETAAVLGWPKGSVKSRTSRALAKLRSAMSEEVADDRS